MAITINSGLSVPILRIIAKESYILVNKLFYLATGMIFVENLSILPYKNAAIFTHLLLRNFLTFEESLLLLVFLCNCIDFPYDFLLFFINNKATTSTLLTAYYTLNIVIPDPRKDLIVFPQLLEDRSAFLRGQGVEKGLGLGKHIDHLLILYFCCIDKQSFRILKDAKSLFISFTLRKRIRFDDDKLMGGYSLAFEIVAYSNLGNNEGTTLLYFLRRVSSIKLQRNWFDFIQIDIELLQKIM